MLESVTKALDIMKEKGYKITPKRIAMLTFIAESGKFMSAKDVQENLQKTYTGLSYDTVYRNLYTFVELGILEMSERNSEKVFLMHCTKHAHHHHFICDNCQQITEIADCPVDFLKTELPNYLIKNHRFEVSGLCPNCLEKQPEKEIEPEKPTSCSCGYH